MFNQNILKISDFSPEVPVVFLHAHADDESFLSGGIINFLASHNIRTIIVYLATAVVEGEARTLLRQQEADAACSLLGVKEVVYLPYCEPKYHGSGVKNFINQNITDVADVLANMFLEKGINGPCVLFSYDKNGGYGNGDHKLLHLLGREMKDRDISFSRTLYEVTLNRDKINNWLKNAGLRLDQKSLPKLSYWAREFGLADADIDYKFSLSEESCHIKKMALTAHASQIKNDEFPLSLNVEDFFEVFGTEYFKLVS